MAVVRTLRTKGYDVLVVLEACPGAENQFVIELAKREERVLFTEDKDFGRLVYLTGASKVGVVLLRFPANVVVQLGRVRIRRLP